MHAFHFRVQSTMDLKIQQLLFIVRSIWPKCQIFFPIHNNKLVNFYRNKLFYISIKRMFYYKQLFIVFIIFCIPLYNIFIYIYIILKTLLATTEKDVVNLRYINDTDH